MIDLVLNDQTIELALNQSTALLVHLEKQGPAGATGSQTVTVVAGATLGGQRVVVLDSSSEAIHADSDTVAHAGRILGVTATAATTGNDVIVNTFGTFIEPSWTWTPGALLYLSLDGIITETPPTSGFVQQIAFAISATEIFIHTHTFIEV